MKKREKKILVMKLEKKADLLFFEKKH